MISPVLQTETGQTVGPNYSPGHCVLSLRSAALSSSVANVWIISAVIMQSTVVRSQAKATSHSMDRHHSHCKYVHK